MLILFSSLTVSMFQSSSFMKQFQLTEVSLFGSIQFKISYILFSSDGVSVVKLIILLDINRLLNFIWFTFSLLVESVCFCCFSLQTCSAMRARWAGRLMMVKCTAWSSATMRTPSSASEKTGRWWGFWGFLLEYLEMCRLMYRLITKCHVVFVISLFSGISTAVVWNSRSTRCPRMPLGRLFCRVTVAINRFRFHVVDSSLLTLRGNMFSPAPAAEELSTG